MAVEKEKARLLLVYEDGIPIFGQYAKKLKASLCRKFNVKTRKASETLIADILAADVYIFGLSSVASSCWKEIKRVAIGINLAGRNAAFFLAAGKKTNGLKKALGDTDLVFFSEDFHLSENADPNTVNDIKPWLDQFLASFLK